MGNLTQNVQPKAATMSSLDLVAFINSEREESQTKLRHDNFMAKVPKVLGDQAPNFLGTSVYTANGVAHSRRVYNFPKREACLMAMSYSYELQAKVFDRMTELEQRAAQPFQIPQSMAEALRLAADQQERIEQQQRELDHAIATKSQISSSREASVMGKLSAASRKMKQLEQELGRNAVEATVTAVEKAVGRKYGKQGFRPLKKWCKENAIAPSKVPCPRYGEVVAWPAAAWLECYGVDLEVLFGGDGQ